MSSSGMTMRVVECCRTGAGTGRIGCGGSPPTSTSPLSQAKALGILQERVDRHWDVPTGLEAELQREVVARLTAADGIHYLGELGDEAVHDWGRVHDCFHAFVLVDRSAGRISLVVAADD